MSQPKRRNDGDNSQQIHVSQDILTDQQYSGHIIHTPQSQAAKTFTLDLEVESMTIDKSALFLLHRANLISEQASRDEASKDDYAVAVAIAQELGGHPLALDLAGAYIEGTHGSLSEYLSVYRQQQSTLLQERKHRSNDNDLSPVSVTLSLTCEQITHMNPLAMEILRFFAFLHPEDIPGEMFRQCVDELNERQQALAADPLDPDTAISTLLRFSLVRHHADTMTLRIHPLVQTVLKEAFSPDLQRQLAIGVVRLVSSVFPDVNFRTRDICERYLPQAQQCAQLISEFHLTQVEAAQIFYELGCYCHQRTQYAQAEIHLEKALQFFEQDLGLNYLETAHCLNAQASLYSDLGNYQKAELLQQRALTILEQFLDPDHGETAAMLDNLGLIYQERGKYSLAEPLYERALAIYKATLPPGHSQITHSLNNLATLYQEQGDSQRAEDLFVQVLHMREEALETEHPDIATSLNNLAMFYEEQQNYQQVEALLVRALHIYEHTEGTKHPDVAMVLNNLALLYRKRGHYSQAEPLYLRAQTIYEQVLGPDHPDIALILNNLGKLYSVQQQYLQAKPLLQRAVAIREQVLGSQHPDTTTSLNNLAELYRLQGKHQQAEALYLRVLERDKKVH
jgi:tetratricopeptide (TPR) repeat protein